MKEFFEHRRVSGSIKIALKDDDGNVIHVWEADKETLSNHIVEIVEDYREQGYRLTLRQLYYQLVTKNYIPNHDTAYKKISSLKDDLCYSGKLDWDSIEDRGRVPHIRYHVENMNEAIQDTIDAYCLNRQKAHNLCMELWSEKDAISGILKKVTQKYLVKLCINKGYTSSSAVYSSYKRFAEQINNGQKVLILYFGDHDPSGLDMVRDIEDRLLLMFTRGKSISSKKAITYWEKHGDKTLDVENRYIKIFNKQKNLDEKDKSYYEAYKHIESAIKKFYLQHSGLFSVKHIGLTKQQIKQFNLPPNPAKITDPRANEYIKQHGKTSWEVDALPPAELVSIVEKEIRSEINMKRFQSILGQEQVDIKKIKTLFNK